MDQMKKRITNILIFILVLWAIKVIDTVFILNLSQFGIVPRTIRGLWGIAFAPLLHATFYHLMSNTVPIFVLLFLLFTFYKKHAIMVSCNR
jgi:membrane associated rhomboid family serine protease